MDLHNSKSWTRRDFLHTGVGLVSATMTVPWFLTDSAKAMQNTDPALASIPDMPEDRILVVVQLAGGNDGLNTVIPFGDPEYYRARPGIAIPESQALTLEKSVGLGLHPQMTALKELYDDALVSIVQGVGYPNPNRSHFTSTDIWHTGDTSGIGDGWIGRFFDNDCAGSPDGCSGHAGIAIGRSAPLAMQGRRFKPISFETQELFRWSGLDLHESMAEPYNEITKGGPDDPDHAPPANTPPAGSNEAFLTRTALDAQLASSRIREAVAQRPLVPYPGNGLARQLAMVAQMIRAGLETRVYYVTLGGFDTHAGQGAANGRHGNLMNQMSESVAAFYRDLKAQGNDGRVLTISFSEFGRRVAQNGSGGTDHGTAAPMFLMGPMVKPGIHGKHPSLKSLDNGDLRFHTDFRTVYASIVDDWMGADAKKVLGGTYKAADVLKV